MIDIDCIDYYIFNKKLKKKLLLSSLDMEPSTLDKKIDSTKCDSFFITKCDDYYKVWQLRHKLKFGHNFQTKKTWSHACALN